MFRDSAGKNADCDRDQHKAVEYYKLAAAQGHEKACLNLGCMYNEGKGVCQDLDAALRYYNLAIGRGNAKAKSAKAAMLKSSLWSEHEHLKAKYPDRPLPPELQERLEDKRVKRFPGLEEGILGPVAPGVMKPSDMNDDPISNMPGAGHVLTYSGEDQPLVPADFRSM